MQVYSIQVPAGDGLDYLMNGVRWLSPHSLFSPFRPPLISWIVAGVWTITGQDWLIIKYIIPTFTIASGIILYKLIRRDRGSLFALGVTVLTLTNIQVFIWGSFILTESLSLFFLLLSFYFIRSNRKIHWFLAGVALGLCFASRYPVVIQALSIIVVESVLRKNYKIITYSLLGGAPTAILVILAIILKTGTFSGAVVQDTQLTTFLSTFYIANSVDIWGYAFLLVPIAFLFRRTYTDRKNLTFIIWFIVGLLFWSANFSNHQTRFAIQFTPAVYYLVILAVENISRIRLENIKSTLSKKQLISNSGNRLHILEVALDHYSNRLKQLVDDGGSLPAYLPVDYIKYDLLKESRSASDLKKNLTLPQGEFSGLALNSDHNRKLARCALRCYMNDLSETIKIVKEKLSGAHPNFEQVDKELSSASKAYDDICKDS